MVKQNSRQRREMGRVATTPSPYGSHRCMMVSPEEYNVDLQGDEVLCRDDIGLYVTTLNRIDSGLADPHRYVRGR